ncbi:MAG: cytochrome c biogenesis CcdA family protein [Candidatus Thorarchaeota archaeon]
MEEITFAIAFFAGLAMGITPCILLMLSVFGGSLILTEDKKKFYSVSIGLILGMIVPYIVFSILIINFLLIFQAFHNIIKYFFAGFLIFIGIWQILESRKEQSRIFSTPEKVKTLLRDFIQKNSGLYAFLVGIIFVFIKIPCYDLPFFNIIVATSQNPLFYVFIVVYLIGMIIPIVFLLVLFRLGLESSKINDFRLKYRTYLRIFGGALLIFLSIYLLIF